MTVIMEILKPNYQHNSWLGSLDSDWMNYLKHDLLLLFLETFNDVMTSSFEICNFEMYTWRRKFHFAKKVPEASTPTHLKNLWKWFIATNWNFHTYQRPRILNFMEMIYCFQIDFHYILLRVFYVRYTVRKNSVII